MLGRLDISQLFINFNPLWSHNIAHKCYHATFNVDFCYDILQVLITYLYVNLDIC